MKRKIKIVNFGSNKFGQANDGGDSMERYFILQNGGVEHFLNV